MSIVSIWANLSIIPFSSILAFENFSKTFFNKISTYVHAHTSYLYQWMSFLMLNKMSQKNFEISKILQNLGVKLSFESANDVIIWNGAILFGANIFSHSSLPTHHWPISDHLQKYKTYCKKNTDRWLVSDFPHKIKIFLSHR